MSALTLLWWLLVAHVVCDYPLQGSFLARGKNHKQPIPGVPYWQCLSAHALIQAGGVALVTGSVTLGLLEFAFHAMIDCAKCSGAFTFNEDQFVHLLTKLMWAAVAIQWAAK